MCRTNLRVTVVNKNITAHSRLGVLLKRSMLNGPIVAGFLSGCAKPQRSRQRGNYLYCYTSREWLKIKMTTRYAAAGRI